MPVTQAPPSMSRATSRHLLAIALVSIALVLSLALQDSFGNPFWLFFSAAVIASTWIAGTGPGWTAVGVSTLAVLYYFIPPFRSWNIKPRDIPFFATFVAC